MLYFSAKKDKLLNELILKLITFGGKIPLWLPLLLICLLLFPVKGVNTSADSAFYTLLGSRLYQGYGYASDQEPGFPILLSISFWLFGNSIQSAMGVVRLFFVFNILVIYVLGSRLFNRITGLVATLIALTTLEIHRVSSLLLLDSITPFFILLSFLLLFIAFEKKRPLYFGLAGLVWGIAYLVEVSSLLFLPLPALLWLVVPIYHQPWRKLWRSVGLFYVVALVVLLPWFIHLHTLGLNPLRPIISGFSRTLQPLQSTNELDETTDADQTLTEPYKGQPLSQVGSWLMDYYQLYLAERIVLAPLLLLAWGYLFLKAIINQHRTEILLIGGFLLFLPLLPALATEKDYLGARQSYYLYLLSCLALARLLWTPAVTSSLFFQGIRIAGVTAVLAIQIWVGDQGLIHLLRNADPTGYVSSLDIYTSSLWQTEFTVGGWHQEVVRETATWLKKNTRPNESILSDWQWSHSLAFYLNPDQPFHLIEYAISTETFSSRASLAPILFVWSQGGYTNSTHPNSTLNALSESSFLDQVHQLEIKYVVVTKRRNFLSLYLWSNPDFVKIEEFGQGKVQIFEVRSQDSSPGSVRFPMHVGTASSLLLKDMEYQLPAKYEITMSYLKQTLGLSPLEIKQLKENQYPVVQLYRIYTEQDYIALLQAQGADRVEEASVHYRKEVAQNPDNYWLTLILGDLYLAQGYIEEAMAQDRLQEAQAFLEKALELGPDKIYTYRRLGNLYMQQEDYHQAIAVYHRGLVLQPEDEELQNNLIASYLALGKHYAEQEAWSKAIETYQQISEIEPENVTLHWRLGRVYEMMGEFDRAQVEYKRVLMLLEAPSANIYVRLANVSLAQDRLQEAQAFLEKALELGPDKIYTYRRLGNLYMQQEDYHQAIAVYRRGLVLQPEDEGLQNNLIASYLALGKHYAEQEAWSKAIET